jgi:hypothetical protein
LVVALVEVSSDRLRSNWGTPRRSRTVPQLNIILDCNNATLISVHYVVESRPSELHPRITFTRSLCNRTILCHFHCTSHTKYVSNEQGESFHLRPLPSRFHNSRQFSSSPFSYWKLLGSPAFQLVKVMGRPVDIQKKWPSSARSVPEVQKCSCPSPAQTEGPRSFFSTTSK